MEVLLKELMKECLELMVFIIGCCFVVVKMFDWYGKGLLFVVMICSLKGKVWLIVFVFCCYGMSGIFLVDCLVIFFICFVNWNVNVLRRIDYLIMYGKLEVNDWFLILDLWF